VIRGRRTRVKICCVETLAEARVAMRAGADAIGLVGEMPDGPGQIPDETIGEIAGQSWPGVSTVLLTRRTDPDAVTAHVWATGADTVQLVAGGDQAAWAALRRHCPWVKVVQVVHVTGARAEAVARDVAPFVDALLLDSGRPDGPAPSLGGTGRTHDWAVSRRIVEAVGVPVILAGGLTPANVGRAVARVGPWGVDVCTGVRSGGALDPDRVRAFIDAVAAADRAV
jgi:phosphoribosylanthranilate isomerase